MVALVAIETVLLVLLVLLVAGLLRSHAEILRRLGSAGEAGSLAPPAPPGAARARSAQAADVAGATPEGDLVKLAFEGRGSRPTLLAFLTSGCGSCAGFWADLGRRGDGARELPAEVQTVIVTHGAERESPSRLRSLATGSVPVVMSSQAWEDYEVPGSPYFVLVDGGVRGEGVATTWPQLSSMVADAIADERLAAAREASVRGRDRGVDEKLAAAGITPDHPSLYPGS